MNQSVLFRLFSAGLGLAVFSQGLAIAQPAPPSPPAQPEAADSPTTNWYNCLTREVFTPDKQAWCDSLNRLLNGSYSTPTLGPEPQVGVINFENGQFSDPNRELVATLFREQGRVAIGDITGDGETDAVMVMVVNTGGTGNFVYLAPVLDVDGMPNSLMPVGLGDRTRVNTVTILGDSQFSVNMVVQGPNDPACCPSQEVTQFYAIENGEIVPIAPPEGTVPDPDTALLEGKSLAFFQTSGYAVRVFVRDGITRLNLFNKQTGQLELNEVSAVVTPDPEGVTYSYDGPTWAHVYLNNVSGQTLMVDGTLQQDYESVSGTVTYRPRIALPPNAVVEVSLVDVSRADAPATVLACQALVTNGRQVPFAFDLAYDPNQIDSRLTYAVQARISVEGQLQFINTSRFNVITNNTPTDSVEIVVEPVASNSQ
ncbi:MAG: YbaY family lipoprotein [Kaiparowitsia implicata GSE-PSE-MK54-09C]|nr:YbaY family lipoprotein [Kaiparowitsia implicata GSE-PSE-MK54-09C]